ncbi:MAG: Fe-S cluster assembly protein HesB [Actinomycetota bacterium]|nr:Fe-S cluster assembly protein HesB [Actinomycetota bacterium]
MFTVSGSATAAIREIVTQPGIPEGSGLRIAVDEEPGALSISVAPLPQPGDTVFEAGRDASLFIAEGAGDLLADKIMDARTESDGRVRFVLDTAAA